MCREEGWIDVGLVLPMLRRPGIPRPDLPCTLETMTTTTSTTPHPTATTDPLPRGPRREDQDVRPTGRLAVARRGRSSSLSACLVVFSSTLAASHHAYKAPDAHWHPLVLFRFTFSTAPRWQGTTFLSPGARFHTFLFHTAPRTHADQAFAAARHRATTNHSPRPLTVVAFYSPDTDGWGFGFGSR
ncbi:hypothetical protein B0H17DRAFT_1336676 [Mycena rosella]|uniref:Uncharacterized protein n=1 Tax=Mycena rosella TaxID=1033263 RepID=A0AAD7CVN4_MYCRO|nr:hypothetical protein B0H17DRAFT_1336676 [Mycena rosella]